ncbi:hypothetical protein L1887_62969 [Cichorium endivia]|nr:hypothetical protein L1887_62969 [Cichorium endivia]
MHGVGKKDAKWSALGAGRRGGLCAFKCKVHLELKWRQRPDYKLGESERLSVHRATALSDRRWEAAARRCVRTEALDNAISAKAHGGSGCNQAPFNGADGKGASRQTGRRAFVPFVTSHGLWAQRAATSLPPPSLPPSPLHPPSFVVSYPLSSLPSRPRIISITSRARFAPSFRPQTSNLSSRVDRLVPSSRATISHLPSRISHLNSIRSALEHIVSPFTSALHAAPRPPSPPQTFRKASPQPPPRLSLLPGTPTTLHTRSPCPTQPSTRTFPQTTFPLPASTTPSRLPLALTSSLKCTTTALPGTILIQPSMYAPHDPAPFWKPDMVKLEPGTDVFSTAHVAPQFAFPGSQPMMATMSLPAYTTHPMDRRFTFSDAESIGSVPSPSSTSETSTRPGSAKRGAKRKQSTADASLDAASEQTSDTGAKATKKQSRTSAQRRPPPSASHVTEAGKPFPVIDTSAKHSSLFVPPDTSGLTKREARLVKNRAAAFLSRQRKREQFEEMEVITKKGASIAPTADELEGSPAPEAPSARRPSVVPTPAAHKHADADAASAELERVRADLAASHEREQELARQLDAMRASLAAATMPIDNSAGVAGFESIDVTAAQSGLASRSQPFKGVQGAELPLFVPESPLSKFTHMDAAMPDAAHAAFSMSKTPTLATFSETAMRNRSAHQPFVADKHQGFGMGLGLDYKFPTASLPSSPSTASSSSSHDVHHARHLSLPSNSPATGKAPSTLASVLLLAGMSLMGAGPAESAASTARPTGRKPAPVGRKKVLKDAAAADRADDSDGEPSSHLSDDDLLMEMGLDSASISEADDDDDDQLDGDAIKHTTATASKATVSAPALSCA